MIQKKVSKRRAFPQTVVASVPEATPTAVSHHRLDRWEQFWFSSMNYRPLVWMRVGLSVIACYYVLTFLQASSFWLGKDGLISRDQIGKVLKSSETESNTAWQWSVFYLIENPLLLNATLLMIAIAGLIVAGGRGGRPAAIVLWGGVVSLANASWFTADVGLIPLCLGLFSLVIAGTGRSKGRTESFGSMNRLSLRLAQVHLVGFLLAYSISPLSNRHILGEGLRRQALVLGMEWLAALPTLRSIIQSIMILICLVAVPILIWFPKQRTWMLLILTANLLFIGWISSDWIFAGSLIAMASTFRHLEPEQRTDKDP